MNPRIFACIDGEVFQRGIYREPDQCERLLARFRQIAADPTDYFHNDAKVLADQLAEAMEQAQ